MRISLLQPHTPVLPPAQYVKLLDDQDPGLPDPLPDTLSAFEKRVAEVFGVARMDLKKLRAGRRGNHWDQWAAQTPLRSALDNQTYR